MIKNIIDAAKGLMGKGGGTQMGKDNQAISDVKVGDHAGVVIAGNNNVVHQAPPSSLAGDFDELDAMMHPLFEKLRACLKERSDIREVVIYERDLVYNAPRPGFILRDREFPTIYSLIDELETRGYVRDISKTSMKRCLLTEKFAQYLIRTAAA